MTTTKKTVSKCIAISPRQLEMVEELKEKLGLISLSAIVQLAIVDLYAKHINDEKNS